MKALLSLSRPENGHNYHKTWNFTSQKERPCVFCEQGGTARYLSCTLDSHFAFLSTFLGVTIDERTVRKQPKHHRLEDLPESADSLKCQLWISPFQSNLDSKQNTLSGSITVSLLKSFWKEEEIPVWRYSACRGGCPVMELWDRVILSFFPVV